MKHITRLIGICDICIHTFFFCSFGCAYNSLLHYLTSFALSSIEVPSKWWHRLLVQLLTSSNQMELKLHQVQLKSPLNNLILATLWCEPNLTDTNWEKSKWTCIYKSNQTLYRCKNDLLIQERILSQNQLSFPHITVLPDEKVI